jgi:hypothetical protein
VFVIQSRPEMTEAIQQALNAFVASAIWKIL